MKAWQAPPWAPWGLAELHASLPERRPDSWRDRRALLERLLGAEMERPWHEVLKRANGLRPEMFVYEADAALAGADMPRRAPGEVNAQMERVARTARAFALAIRETCLDQSPLEWFPERLISELSGAIDCDAERTGLSNWGAHPAISDVADAIATEAQRLGDFVLQHPIAPKPNAANVRRIIFIRRFGTCLKRECGHYLRGTLAAFATAALQENVGIEHVKDALNGWDPIDPDNDPMWLAVADRPRARGPFPD